MTAHLSLELAAESEINDLSLDPIEQFARWFEFTKKQKLPQYNSMALATASKEGKPSVRMVLLKEYNQLGFVFFTNYESRKSKEILQNPYCSLVFYWHEIDRQIRIEGRAQKLSKEKSESYFQSRSKDSQIGAWASKQSQVLSSRATLLANTKQLSAKYKDQEILPLPPFWGGFILKPEQFEFWINRQDRLHDRFCYSQTQKQEWIIQRLNP